MTEVKGPYPRFIPACAGNGRKPAAPCRGCPVHPRVCGERLAGLRGGRAPAGSSPRVRGTASARRSRSAPSRFIPACAGNGMRAPNHAASKSVHPRVCGERIFGGGVDLTGGGSSPRVRGTDGSNPEVCEDDRFIPACAGNGPSGSLRGFSTAVHPRVCGERSSMCDATASTIGSSPRVRGTVHTGRKG